jgi:hypothetical protein
MTRVQYARYVVTRALEASLVATGAGAAVLLLQDRGLLHPPQVPPAWRLIPQAADAVLRWTWPLLGACAAHVLIGPKQRRPHYLRVPGAMYVYAGIKVDRNAGCRGGCVTGSTGSGKTLSCIIPRLHSLCVNEAGTERPGWRGSPEDRELGRARDADAALRAQARETIPREHAALLGLQAAHSERFLHRLAGASLPLRYESAPWGGFVCGEKGNEWETMGKLLGFHGRAEHLCVLRTRPADAPRSWEPAVRFNLLSIDQVPADTYARLVVETALAVEEAESRDEFFVPQARDKIAWGLRLVRAVARCRGPSLVPAYGLLTLFDILTVQESYRRFLLDCERELPGLSSSEAYIEARFQLENNYWNQPPDQLGGVRSTLYNFLVPFSEPEIAEVFCADSTFSLGDIQLGRVVSLAIPQKFALQRRYVATFLKTLVYQIILERFDLGAGSPGWQQRNVVLVEQDEWQRHAVGADCDVDVVREANGAVYAATQSQNAVWRRLGGRDHAAPLIANLRNRWICQAATAECAEESSGVVSSRMSRELSYSRGDAGSTTTISFAERPLLPARALRALRPFHVVFAPAEGPWLYRSCIAMPATPDGRIPDWWLGDWNPLHWAAHALGLPQRLLGMGLHRGGLHVPPWRAAAPLRAQLRWLFGLDGTFIITGGLRARAGRSGKKSLAA